MRSLPINPKIGDYGLAPNRRQAIIETNTHLINLRIYTALVEGELTIWGCITDTNLRKIQRI